MAVQQSAPCRDAVACGHICRAEPTSKYERRDVRPLRYPLEGLRIGTSHPVDATRHVRGVLHHAGSLVRGIHIDARLQRVYIRGCTCIRVCVYRCDRLMAGIDTEYCAGHCVEANRRNVFCLFFRKIQNAIDRQLCDALDQFPILLMSPVRRGSLLMRYCNQRVRQRVRLGVIQPGL